MQTTCHGHGGRISVRGLGAFTPLGRTIDENWKAVLEGRTAISEIRRFDLGGIACVKGGIVNAAEEGATLAVKMVTAALGEAIASSGVDVCGLGLVCGSNFGDGSQGDAHSPIAKAAKERFGLGGPVASISLSCASGASAVALACEWIVAGYAPAVAVVGYDVITPVDWAGLCSLRTMAKDGVVRPFSAERGGTVFAEGAAAMILSANGPTDQRTNGPTDQRTNGPTFISGWSTGNNGFHLTAPPPRAAGSTDVMRRVMEMSGAGPEALAFVSAHGTGTRANDQTEAEALWDLLGDRLRSVPVTAFKSSSGHLLGAAGVFEAAMAAKALREGMVPPVANVTDADPAIPPVALVTGSPKRIAGGFALVNSAGFGGCNAALALVRDKGDLKSQISNLRCVSAGRPDRIAIRSCGFISALGIGMEEAETVWSEGESALMDYGDGVALGRVPDFDPATILPTAKAYLDRQCLLALSASALAMRDAGLSVAPDRFGVSFGAALGPSATAARFASDCMEKGLRLARPMLFPHTYANAAASLASIEWGLRGHHANFAGGTNASTFAIISAVDALRRGQCDAMLAGGAESLAAGSLENGAGEGAAVFALAREEDGGHGIAPLGFIAETWIGGADAMASAIAEAGLAATDIAAAYVAPSLADAVRDMDGFRGRVVDPSAMYGDVDGASGAMALAAALIDLAEGPALVATADGTGTVAAIVIVPAQRS